MIGGISEGFLDVSDAQAAVEDLEVFDVAKPILHSAAALPEPGCFVQRA